MFVCLFIRQLPYLPCALVAWSLVCFCLLVSLFASIRIYLLHIHIVFLLGHAIAGDNVRLLAKSFTVPGDHLGQSSTGYRWPYGPVAIVSPFNFPLGEPLATKPTSMRRLDRRFRDLPTLAPPPPHWGVIITDDFAGISETPEGLQKQKREGTRVR